MSIESSDRAFGKSSAEALVIGQLELAALTPVTERVSVGSFMSMAWAQSHRDNHLRPVIKGRQRCRQAAQPPVLGSGVRPTCRLLALRPRGESMPPKVCSSWSSTSCTPTAVARVRTSRCWCAGCVTPNGLSARPSSTPPPETATTWLSCSARFGRAGLPGITGNWPNRRRPRRRRGLGGGGEGLASDQMRSEWDPRGTAV